MSKIAKCSSGLTFVAGVAFLTKYYSTFDQPNGIFVATQNKIINTVSQKIIEKENIEPQIPQTPFNFTPSIWEDVIEENKFVHNENEIITPVKLYQSLRQIEEELDETLQMSNWVTISSSNGVIIKQCKKENEPAIFMVETIIDAPPIWVLRCVALKKLREEWDVSVKFEDTVNIENTLICRKTMSESLGGGIISGREFIDLLGLKKDNETLRFISKEYEDCNVPSDDYVIRGKNYGSGIWLAPTPEKFDVNSNEYLGDAPSTAYKAIIQVDIGGWIPQYIQDMAMTTLVIDSFPQMRKWLKENLSEIHE